MAAPDGSGSDCWRVPEVYKHHEQQKVCISRPKYREGRKSRAVKVYTINLESCYLMVQGVPAIGVMTELIQLCALYGVVEEYRPLDEYPAEEFTEVYLVKFQKLPSARAAKRHMDEKSFFGGVLHVCYVPEYETVEDTRFKLQDRRRYIMRAAQNAAREKQRAQAADNEQSVATLEKNLPGQDRTTDRDGTEESPDTNHYSGFPLLPLPPQEHHHTYMNEQQTAPTEDKMGTLHNAVIDTKQQPVQTPTSSYTVSHKNRAAEYRQASAARFVPRTTQLENRKRKIQEAVEPCCETRSNEPLIGPKLPEPPKVDMEDESLNTTVSLIRNTMRQVESVPDLKPVEKKAKPRRRI